MESDNKRVVRPSLLWAAAMEPGIVFRCLWKKKLADPPHRRNIKPPIQL
jgi:hypothetical protein